MGWLTDKTKLLISYYGKAIIRSNTGDCAAMQDAVWTVFIPLPGHHKYEYHAIPVVKFTIRLTSMTLVSVDRL